MKKQRYSLILIGCLLVATVSFADEADDDIDDFGDNDNIERCINARIIRRTDVVDDSHILFYLSGQKVYINILPRPCSGLSRERRFSYTTLNRSLCRLDSIRVLSDVAGAIHQGRSCRLGNFHLTSKEEIEAAQKRGQEPPPIKEPAGADVEEIE